MKIFTLGTGFVSNHLPYPKITDRFLLDQNQIKSVLDQYQPDILINCLGRTGSPNIDWCNSNKEETINGNITLPLLISDYCSKNNIHHIMIGSGCIFSGQSPNVLYEGTTGYVLNTPIDFGWREADFANPVSFYSATKYATDLAIGSLSKTTVLRIRMPISKLDSPRNLINKLKNYKEIINIPNSVTFMSDLVRCIDWVIQNQHIGIFHVTNPQPLTAVDIMKEYQKYIPEHQFSIIDGLKLDQLTYAKRSNCILNTEKINNLGFYMNNSYDSLENCMKKYIINLKEK